MYDYSYDDKFPRGGVCENFLQRHPLLTYIKKISECAGMENDGNFMKNKTWICQMFNK